MEENLCANYKAYVSQNERKGQFCQFYCILFRILKTIQGTKFRKTVVNFIPQ